MTEPTVKPPPFDLDAEEAVLGAMLLSPRAIDAVTDIGLTGEDFYRGSHGLIFNTIHTLYLEDVPADPITVADRLDSTGMLEKIGGTMRLHEVAAGIPAVGNAGHYAEIVRELAVLRALIKAGMEITQLGRERSGPLPEIVDQVEHLIFDLSLNRRSKDFIELSSVLGDTFKRIEALHEQGKSIIGLPSGFRNLDELTSGFQPGNLIVIAARPSMGKSALALNILAHVAVDEQQPVALFTLEMSEPEVTQRLLSAEGQVESQRIRNGRLGSEDWERLTAAGARLHNANIHIDDSGTLTAIEVRSKARRLKLRHPDLSLVVVDYLQLMESGSRSENRVQDVSQTSRALKALARDLNVPVIALSQLSRAPEQRHDKRPMLRDLRESGSIEQDADLVAFIYRDEYYNPEDAEVDGTSGIAELDLAKHRNGPTGMVKLAFVKRFAKFGTLGGSL